MTTTKGADMGTTKAIDLSNYTDAQIREARARSLGCGAATPCRDVAVALLAGAMRKARA